VISANGCRCNSVEDKELPAPAAASSVAFKSDDCGPEIGGLESIAAAPVVILGELHGLTSAPAFTGDLACRLALSQSVVLALEIPTDEQARLDAFLASEGRTPDRAALTSGPFWTGVRDGRSSQARLDLLETIRQLNRRGAKIRVRAIDVKTNRDEGMANNVIAAARESKGPVLVLVGNLHARIAPKGEAKWMGEYVRDAVPGVVSLDNRYGDGQAWVCAPECGRRDVKARDGETDNRWRIELAPSDDKTYSGVWRIGPARPSEPAVPP
jgi:hypothetical protein